MVQLSWMTMIVIVYNIWIPRHMFVFLYDLASKALLILTQRTFQRNRNHGVPNRFFWMCTKMFLTLSKQNICEL